jgi:tRNA threonylcarbamoyladenosine biosynthesis protein TsaB
MRGADSGIRVLALDTATEACSAALLKDGDLIVTSSEAGRAHAEQILAMVDHVLRESGLALGSLTGIAASVGPGSFTGVRISVSVAQGLAFGSGVPIVGVTTLEALALKAVDAGAAQVLACLDARMGEVYWGCYRADPRFGVTACGPPAVGVAAAITARFSGPYHGIGRGFRAYPLLRELPGIVILPGACEALPDAREMARLGAARLAAGEGRDPADLAPVYLRNKVALTEAERAAVSKAP